MLRPKDKFRFRIALTEQCQATCPHCFNAGSRHGLVMDAGKLFRFLDYNAGIPSQAPKNYATRAYIMGGEPSLHPDFVRVVNKLDKYFKAKSLFSNGLELGSWMNRVKFGPRDSLILNGYAVDLDNPDLRKAPRNTCYHFVVTPHTVKGLTQRVDRVFNERLGGVCLSIDTTRDLRLPEERHVFLEWKKIFNRYVNKGHPFGIDHAAPYCLRDKALSGNIKALGKGVDLTGCGRTKLLYHTTCMGLIKANFDLMYCNQTPMRVRNLFDGGKPITFQELYDSLVIARNRKLECLAKHDPRCAKCRHLKDCLGGCIFHKGIPEAAWAEGALR